MTIREEEIERLDAFTELLGGVWLGDESLIFEVSLELKLSRLLALLSDELTLSFRPCLAPPWEEP